MYGENWKQKTGKVCFSYFWFFGRSKKTKTKKKKIELFSRIQEKFTISHSIVQLQPANHSSIHPSIVMSFQLKRVLVKVAQEGMSQYKSDMCVFVYAWWRVL